MVINEVSLDKVPIEQIETIVDQGLRHKTGLTPKDYLFSFLRISRPLAYATYDESWGEFEKHFAIIIRRMIEAERRLKLIQAFEQQPTADRG